MDIFVTVGMSRWPFDRLLSALHPLLERHKVFAQTGCSEVRLACRTAAYLSYGETIEFIRNSDVVITHAGNTVRIIQRMGKVPIAMAREKRHGEMSNDHQVEFLRSEQKEGLVVSVWDGRLLPEIVAAHGETEKRLLRTRALPQIVPEGRIVEIMEALTAKWVS